MERGSKEFNLGGKVLEVSSQGAIMLHVGKGKTFKVNDYHISFS